MNDDQRSRQARLELLQALYEQADWTRQTQWACQAGCSSCCTRSVTMTTIEGIAIIDFLRKNRQDLFQSVHRHADTVHTPKMTTNMFAKSCLDMLEDRTDEVGEQWDFTPCIFLENDYCAIYPVRPFNCRCFLSEKKCSESGYAQIAPLTLTLNTVFHQLIEHIDATGYWGNMIAILAFLLEQTNSGITADQQTTRPYHLLPCTPLPGFLIPPEEKEEVQGVLHRLYQTPVEGDSFINKLSLPMK